MADTADIPTTNGSSVPADAPVDIPKAPGRTISSAVEDLSTLSPPKDAPKVDSVPTPVKPVTKPATKPVTKPVTKPAAPSTQQPSTNYDSYFFDLISWKDPRASAIAYVSIVSFIFAIRYLDILRWGLRITWMVLGTTVAAEVVGRAVLGSGLATQLRPRRYYVVPRETLDMAIGDVQELINFFVIEAQRIMFAENLAASIATCVAAFVSYHLVKIMPYWGLAIFATTLAFAMPPLYTSNQELIDNQIKQASDAVNAQTAQLRSVASKHTAQATSLTKQYMGDYTAKAQQMLRGKPVQSSDFPVAPKGAFASAASTEKPAASSSL